jgi:endonuclease/exonuclease/phosphatase family metal-dependent hydrolase
MAPATGTQVTDALPAELAAELTGLRGALDARIPAKALDRNLLIGTWNLREFGRVTHRWRSEPGDSPIRDLYSLRVIAEVLSRFDVVALQEVLGNIEALRHTLRVLGSDWALILTDVTLGPAGAGERLAFLFDTRRVKPSGLAAELVIPPERLESIAPGALQRQFARTPYAVSFASAGQTFILVTLHVIYGRRADDRTGELAAIADWMRDWADRTTDYSQNLIALGDFNIDRHGDPNYEAFVSRGLRPPPELEGLPRTLPTASGEGNFYDQIAWFHEGRRSKLTLRYTGRAGNFHFDEHVLRDLDRRGLSFRISDHYPLWAEFGMRRDPSTPFPRAERARQEAEQLGG